MALMYFEGTKDYLVSTPALIISLRASGSITAGAPVKWDASNSSDVWEDTAGVLAECAGVSLRTVATGEAASILVWGFVKNLLANEVLAPGDLIMLTGSDFGKLLTGADQMTGHIYKAGRVVSGSAAAGKFMAFINVM